MLNTARLGPAQTTSRKLAPYNLNVQLIAAHTGLMYLETAWELLEAHMRNGRPTHGQCLKIWRGTIRRQEFTFKVTHAQNHMLDMLFKDVNMVL